MIEGFDDGLYVSRHSYTVGLVVDAAYGAHGNGVKVGDLGGTFYDAIDATDMTLTVGFSVNLFDGVGGDILFGYYDNLSSVSYYNVEISYDEDNNRLYVVDRTGSVYAVAGSFYQNTRYYLEFRATFHQTAGSWELRQDGETILSATGRDTLFSSSATKNNFVVWGWDNSSWVDVAYLDDMYLLDSAGTSNTTFLGNIEVATLLPSGNGSSSGMTGSDSNQVDNYLLVDNNAAAPPATTEYVGSATEGDKDTYAMGDLVGTPTVYGVLGTVYAAKNDTGGKYMRTVLRSGSADYVGTSKTLSDSAYGVIEEMYDVDPDTAAQWTYAAVNAMEFGQEVRDS